MRDSRAGYVLTLIGGVLTLLLSLCFFILSIVLFTGGTILEYFLGSFTIPVNIIGFLSLLVFAVVLVLGILKIVAARMVRHPSKTFNGGLMALIVGIITSDPFSLIGGIFGVIQGAS